MEGFTRPKVSWNEWEREPLMVAQKVAMAIALHIEPFNMTLDQRSLVYAWLYHGNGNNKYGLIFINALFANDDDTFDETSLQYTHEALLKVGAKLHFEIFQRALDRWKSKPRIYRKHEIGNNDKYAAWIHDVVDPVCNEFLDLDEEAFMVRPTMESHIIDFLRKHRKEFVKITEN